MREQFHQPRYFPGAFASWHGVKVRVEALRWDSVHQEFQYQIRASGVRSAAVWVSERNIL